MPSIKDKLKAEERNERTIRLWPDGYGYKAAVAPAVPPPAPAYSDVEARLRSFNLAAATPLDCMLLVNELQKMLGMG